MEALDWIYNGEGGKHAVFKSIPNDRNNPRSDSRLLRIEKHFLALSDYYNTENIKVSTSPTSTIGLEDSLCSILQPFADPLEKIALEWNFVYQLKRQTLNGNKVPHRRRKDWTCECVDSYIQPYGLLMIDYRSYGFTSSRCRSESIVHASFEIKPKAGYIAFSPCVDENRTAKYDASRFVLQQKLYAEGKLRKGWMLESKELEVSSYNPIDLFSGSPAKIRRALESMLTCPQNNLKAWLDHHNILKHAEREEVKSSKEHLLGEMLGVVSAHESFVTSLLVDLTTEVLLKEDVLPKLLELQKLDILDGDGANLVFSRLVDLCGGRVDKAERIIDETWIAKDAASCAPHSLLLASPFNPPKDASNITKLCNGVQLASASLNNWREESHREQLRQLRDQSFQTINKLSLDEAVYLLQTWLFSLSMCDVSFFVTFQFSSTKDTYFDVMLSGESSNHAKVLTKQKLGIPGTIAFRTDPQCLTCNNCAAYQVKLIDFGRKPASKIRSRQNKESLFNG